MVDYAESYFYLDIIAPDGTCKRDHLKIVAQSTNKVPNELKDLPELPESAAHVWRWFLDLNSHRKITVNGPSAISYSEILAWQELNFEKLKRWEVTAIKALDRAFLNRKD